MPLLTLDDACLAFGDVALLDHAALVVEPREKIALIGRNGTGKSSLLRAMADEAARLDDGTIWRQPGLRMAYVAQEPDFALDRSVFATVAEGVGETARLIADYHVAAQALANGDESAMTRLAELQHALEAGNGWVLHHKVEQVLTRLRLDGEARVDSLSGGGIKRVALARALVGEPELLLLDEPTNHLDIDAIAWLEELIRSHGGAVVVITHDRSFMDAIATRIVELDRGKLASFPGSFTEYQRRKADLLAMEEKANAEFDKFLAQEEAWIRKGVEARRTRSVGRVARLESLRSQRTARRERLGQVSFQLERGEASGQMVSELHNVTKRYGARTVVRDFSTRILRGDRIGFIGPNGAGKTTLLKLILGDLQPDDGQVRIGARLQIAYFDQFRTQLDPEAALTDVISPGSEFVEIGGTRKHVIGYLGDFLFAPSRARSPVKSLSGGERNRLLLARLFARPANVLVLDEPTNDLDIETLELLEELLQDYAGTVLLVSHDRAFLDNVVTQVIASEGDGAWKEYAGGYSDWARVRTAPPAAAAETKPAKPATPAPTPAAGIEAKPAAKKLSFNEKRELDALPERIAKLEAEQTSLQQRLADPEVYRSQAAEVPKMNTRLAEIEEQLLEMLDRWSELESRA